MANGYRLYADVWENKPPVLYLLYEAVYQTWGPSLVAIRVVTSLAACAVVLLVIAISRRYVAPAQALVAGLLAGLLLGVPFLEGTTGNAEMFLILFTCIGVWLGLRGRYAVSGCGLGVAVLFKVVALFDVAALVLWLLARPAREGREEVERLVLTPEPVRRMRAAVTCGAGAAVPVLLAGALAWRSGVLGPMLRDAVLYDLGYVGSANGAGIPWLILLKLLILLALTVRLVRSDFPLLWLAWAAAGSLISGRFFGHYALQAVPPLCVALALAVYGRSAKGGPDGQLPPWRRPRAGLIGLPAGFLALAGAAALVGYGMMASGHDSILARRLQWYPNFLRLATGAESYAVYRNQVDDHVSRNIRIASYLRRVPAGKLLVWGNVPWVYVLSHRLPATPYTSAWRDPEVPGETRTLRRAIERRSPVAVVVIQPPLPPLGTASRGLRSGYRPFRRVGDGALFSVRARPAPAPTRAAARDRSS
jgi:4-amino-4-deoxy-L-arabinose transferase-like glycosyltransferase